MPGLEMPHDFPVGLYEKIYGKIDPYRNKPQNVYTNPFTNQIRGFLGGWFGLAFRFKQMAENDEAFVKALLEFGDGSGLGKSYSKERAIYSFFLSGLSTFECLCFSIYSLGSILDESFFPMTTEKDIKDITPLNTARKLNKKFLGEGISISLDNLVLNESSHDNRKYYEWKKGRNILAHRAAPRGATTIHVGSPGGGHTITWEGFVLNDTFTSLRREWLSNQINELLSETLIFAEKYLISDPWSSSTTV